MSFVQFSKVSLAFGNRDILESVSLNLAAGTRAALAGANGSGKSTLMKVLAGTIQPDSGERAIQKDTRVSYLPQSGLVHSGKTLREEIETAFTRGHELLERLESLGDELARIGASEEDEAKTLRLVEEHHEVQVALEDSGWHRRFSLAEQTLLGLGFTIEDFSRGVQEFSGGWQMRIALAKVLLEHPDILLLDEPTNYLDLEARNWLEGWLREYTGGFLIVSHDRYFLDVTINEVYELFGGSLKRYVGTYTRYEEIRAQELEALIKKYDEQQEEIAKTEDFIRRFRYNASKAAMVQDRVKRLEKVERIQIPESLKKMHFHFPPVPHTGRLILTTTNLGKRYGDRKIIDGLDLVLEKKERLVVVGRNGAGKSTLLRILSGADIDYSGTVNPGAGVLAGYFSQDNAEHLSGPEKILDLLESEAPLELIPRLRDMLASFLFRGDDIYKQVSVLSGGEKSRLALLRILLKPLNLLILDEPTNHLDLHSKDVLLEALRSFDGTVIFVSHDRGFIEGLATRVLELTAGSPGIPSRVRNFPGEYRYYLDQVEKEAEALLVDTQPSKAGTPSSSVKPSETSSDSLSSGARSYEEEKRFKAERRKLEKEEQRLLAEIDAAEVEIKELEVALSTPEVYIDAEKSKAVQAKTAELTDLVVDLSTQWEDIVLQLEEKI